MPKLSRQSIGRWGESLAAQFLSERGYVILEKNARTPYGELDLVTRLETLEGWLVVFVEVKARTSSTLGPPEISVATRKRGHLLASAQTYMQSHPELGGDYRIDVIAIQRTNPGHPPDIVHFENAVS